MTGASKPGRPRDVYETFVQYLVDAGWRREELGSGWWWKDGDSAECTIGEAVETQLTLDEIDTRDAIGGEPEEYWG